MSTDRCLGETPMSQSEIGGQEMVNRASPTTQQVVIYKASSCYIVYGSGTQRLLASAVGYMC